MIRLPTTKYRVGQELIPNNPNGKPSVGQFSTYEYVERLKSALSPELFQRLEASFLGPIISVALNEDGGKPKAHTKGLGFSGQILLFLLCRQIHTARPNELWFYFAGQPMRFALREFHLVTGLPCEETCEEDVEDTEAEHQFVWPLIDKGDHTLESLLNQLEDLPDDAQESKFRLAMLLLIESIFLMRYIKSGQKFSYRYVKLAKTKITIHPWGKEAFNLLVDSVNTVPEQSFDKGKFGIKGFPLALHLWLLASVPKLEAKLAIVGNHSSEFVCTRYSRTLLPSYKTVSDLEASPNLEVACVLVSVTDLSSLVQVHNDHLEVLMNLVMKGYRLSQHDWDSKVIELEKAEQSISGRVSVQDARFGEIGELQKKNTLLEEELRKLYEVLGKHNERFSNLEERVSILEQDQGKEKDTELRDLREKLSQLQQEKDRDEELRFLRKMLSTLEQRDKIQDSDSTKENLPEKRKGVLKPFPNLRPKKTTRVSFKN